VGGKCVVANGRAYAPKLVCRHASARSRAADEDSAIGGPIADGFGDSARVVGIVDGVGRMRPEIKYIVPEFTYFLDNASFQWKPGMVGCNGNFHAVSYDSAHALVHPCGAVRCHFWQIEELAHQGSWHA
jgi:hypothetical protein